MARRDLVGPHPDLDPDLAREVLAGASPSTFYLTGFLGPRRGAKPVAKSMGGEAAAEEQAQLRLEEQRGSEGMELGATGRGVPADEGANERPPSRSFEPSSLGLTGVHLWRRRVHPMRRSSGDRCSDLVRAGGDPTDLAREFEPSAQAIRNWVAAADLQSGRKIGPAPDSPALPSKGNQRCGPFRRIRS